MTISMYQASVPLLIRALKNMVVILKKGEDYAEAKNIDPTALLNSRLYPDMFPFVRQVQVVSDLARRGVARLAGVEVIAMEDTETTFPELIERMHQSVAYIETFTPEQINNTEETILTLPIGEGQTMDFRGWEFLSFFVLPNVYFHVTTAYDILRHNGVEIGKRDYLGRP
ncbi:DUF1993 domain-containing protein [Leptolyngbyaceae cyanobacterium CCMR0082]|uniref:DUF1993 domain-containing protein n=2 Tax=Adonisia turfae TaxID=2950184 RepID=A0A6M0SCY4_9CYAN|nr:DUF1993 domain-containing protein [Adonisia turfae]MDV3353839.1 DUF1993 domain-containing protein [Leptothoe sp. LEGE 181152]NEZ58015.1 DUF1993 domain-containing protein [Adonisia turfae CCMR0081]NEZ66176.1 DUF1993 domain-containing protein [Adonisia turfae CCMR0082]